MDKRGPIVAFVLALLGPAGWAEADTITYQFQVTATSGSLTGETSTGTFAFDSSLIPPGGGRVVGLHLFNDLDFAWNGIHYDATNTQTGLLQFDSGGNLSQWEFGTACFTAGGGGCVVRLIPPGFTDWEVRNNLASRPPSFFEYGFPDLTFGFGTENVTNVAPTPEPLSVTLLGAALFGLGIRGFHQRRNKRRRWLPSPRIEVLT